MVCIGDKGDGAPPDFLFPVQFITTSFHKKTDGSSGPVLWLSMSSIYSDVPIKKSKSETKANLYSKLQDKNTTKQLRLPPIRGLFKDNSTC